MTKFEPKLFRLVYFSKISPAVRSRLPANVRSIQTVAQHRNRAVGVTGLLIAADGFFAQALEGDQNAVEETFSRIAKDLRHSLPAVVMQHSVPSRIFGGWSMSARQLSAEDSYIIQRLEERGGFNPALLNGESLLSLLSSVGTVHRARFDRQQKRVAYI